MCRHHEKREKNKSRFSFFSRQCYEYAATYADASDAPYNSTSTVVMVLCVIRLGIELLGLIPVIGIFIVGLSALLKKSVNKGCPISFILG